MSKNAPFDIVIDHEHDHVYWTENIPRGKIMRYNLDGSNQSVILDTDLYFPQVLSLDNIHGYDTLYIDILWLRSEAENGATSFRSGLENREQEL